MDDRSRVFANIRAALAQRTERTPRPEIDFSRIVAARRLTDPDLWANFARNLKGVRGYFFDTTAALAQFLREQNAWIGYCDPALRGSVGEPLAAAGLDVRYDYQREEVDVLTFAVTRASAVIAETGTIILRDFDSSNRLAAVAPWIHVAAAASDAIVRTVEEGIATLGDDPSSLFVTGPSKTADVEGILIEGVHGPGEQVCLRI